ncbi:MAG TPA: hypothetical protein VK988_04090 [Acidimicrobiales bacterium]|nr:hypothetical protein [Acidimicrobiales bacterium]
MISPRNRRLLGELDRASGSRRVASPSARSASAELGRAAGSRLRRSPFALNTFSLAAGGAAFGGYCGRRRITTLRARNLS